MRSPPTLLVPPVEPVQTLKIDPESARKINALVPLAGSSNPAAEPFRFTGSFENASRQLANERICPVLRQWTTLVHTEVGNGYAGAL